MSRMFYACYNKYTFRKYFTRFYIEYAYLVNILYVLFTVYIRGLTKFANSPPCDCRGSRGQKPQCGLMMLAYQRFTDVLLLIYGSLFLSSVYYCLSVFWCAVARISNSGSQIREMLVQV
jgi:hypothetical protein